MAFKPGEGGRPVGATNKTTKLVKEVFAEVFEKMQDEPDVNLLAWGKDNPTEFYKIASKLIPIQLGSDPDNPLPQVTLFQLPDNGRTTV